MNEKKKLFFTGYKPQFYFRTEENKKKFGESIEKYLPKIIDPTESPSASGSRQEFEGGKGNE